MGSGRSVRFASGEEMHEFFDGDVNTGDPKLGGGVNLQPVMPFPLFGEGKDQWKLITLEYSVVSPDTFGKRAQIRLQLTPVVPGLVQSPIFGGR